MAQFRIITSRIPSLAAPKSLTNYLGGRFTYLTEEQWQKEITDGKITLNGKIVGERAIMLKGGEILAWDGSSIVEPEVDDRITILYEDEEFIAVNKPGNLPVHAAGRYFHNTLVAIMTERCGRTVYPVHRIDRETSGVILLSFAGKNTASLAASLAQGSKEYLALVHGNFPTGEVIVDLPLGRDAKSAVSKKRRAWPDGTETALTRFQRILTVGNFSLVRCFPATGRLHQIRAHLLAAGYPIVGDKLYGRDESAFLNFIEHGLTAELAKRLILPRQALHAARMAFFHRQTEKELVIRAPLPWMFSEFIRSRKTKEKLFF